MELKTVDKRWELTCEDEFRLEAELSKGRHDDEGALSWLELAVEGGNVVTDVVGLLEPLVGQDLQLALQTQQQLGKLRRLDFGDVVATFPAITTKSYFFYMVCVMPPRMDLPKVRTPFSCVGFLIYEAGGLVGASAFAISSPIGTPRAFLPPFLRRIIFRCVGFVMFRKNWGLRHQYWFSLASTYKRPPLSSAFHLPGKLYSMLGGSCARSQSSDEKIRRKNGRCSSFFSPSVFGTMM